MSRKDQLAERWLKKRDENRALDKAIPDTERIQDLRGSVFTGELIRLWALTDDARFVGALQALLDHGVINGPDFVPNWEAPAVAGCRERIEEHTFDAVRILVEADPGRRISTACAEVAAGIGIEANSFDAAVKYLERLYRRRTKGESPES